MRLILMLFGLLGAGAAGVIKGVIPLPAQMSQAVTALGGDPAQIKNVNVNPVQAYNKVLPQILNGGGSSAMDFHGSAVTIPPGSFRVPASPATNPGALAQRGVAASILSQVQQNNARMQDLAAFARNPAGWHGAPPH